MSRLTRKVFGCFSHTRFGVNVRPSGEEHFHDGEVARECCLVKWRDAPVCRGFNGTAKVEQLNRGKGVPSQTGKVERRVPVSVVRVEAGSAGHQEFDDLPVALVGGSM